MSTPVPNAPTPDPGHRADEPVSGPAPGAPQTRRDAAAAQAGAWSTGSSGPPARWSGAIVAIGIVSVVLGVLVLVWPKATLLVVALIFGLQLIAAGAVRLSVTGDLPHDPGWVRPVSVALGILSIIAGIICLFRPGTSLVVIAILIAAGWIAEGVAALVHGFASGRSTGSRVFLFIFGAISIVAGIVVAVWPGATLVVLTRLAGILLIVIGVAELVTVFVVRRAVKAPAAA
ncbi:DUF308 domain-containing protein [Terrabacter sp. NPDC080008]|uniref:HdeD family acid-resistance protein n=1 Tax=Terrabacter sp. NPDC080008 TaxID=3155176 RepID=UPI0034503879